MVNVKISPPYIMNSTHVHFDFFIIWVYVGQEIFKREGRIFITESKWIFVRTLSPHQIEECISRVSEIMEKETNDSPNKALMRTQTWGKYAIYSPNDHTKIRKYAAEKGPVATMRKFTTILSGLKVSTVCLFRNLYKKEIKARKRKIDFDTGKIVNIVELQSKNRGRKPLLGGNLDSMVKLYLPRLRNSWDVVNTAICRAMAHGIVTAN
jgi:hypothetical protein